MGLGVNEIFISSIFAFQVPNDLQTPMGIDV